MMSPSQISSAALALNAHELIAAGLEVGQVVVYAADLETMGDDDVAEVKKAIRKANWRSEVNDDGDLVIVDLDRLETYEHLGFSADVEDGDVLFQTGPHACLWLVSKALLQDHPSGWRAQLIEHINEAGGVQWGALVYDLRHRALDPELITRVVDAGFFRLNKLALWADVQAELAKHDAE